MHKKSLNVLNRNSTVSSSWEPGLWQAKMILRARGTKEPILVGEVVSK